MRMILRLLRSIPKPLRILFDLLLAALLFFAWFVAIGGPRFGEEERFRRAEKANLVGPSVILDRIFTQGDWFPTTYNRLLIGDAGDEILFYGTINERSSRYGVLTRREKTDGLLCTTLPQARSTIMSSYWPDGDAVPEMVIPLFLFVDDPRAVRSEVRLKLTEDWEVTLEQYRGADTPPEELQGWTVRDRYFLLLLPVPPETWDSQEKAEALRSLLWTNDPTTVGGGEFPATILLYDAEGRLLETRDYVIRSRIADAGA